MTDSFIPVDPRRSFMPRLKWRQTKAGPWQTDILDTSQPEQMMILPVAEGDGVRLVVYRPLTINGNWRTHAHTLGMFVDPDAAMEFARDLVGDDAVHTVDSTGEDHR